VLDASEFAVSWRLTRESGSTSVEVRAAAAPHLDAGLPGHLWPRARVVTTAAPTDFGLQPNGDTWIGGAPIDAENVVRVDIYVPGVGPAIGAADSGYGPAQRQRIREFVVARLRTPGRSGLLLEAERVAAASDTDF
jgi:hypothetical protein